MKSAKFEKLTFLTYKIKID